MKFWFLLTLFLSILTFIVVDAKKSEDKRSPPSTLKHRQIGLGEENPPAETNQPNSKTVPTHEVRPNHRLNQNEWNRRGNFGETRQDGTSQKNPQRSWLASRNRRLQDYPKRREYGQKQGDNLLKPQAVPRSRQGVHYTPLGVAAPVGPIEKDRVLQKKYGRYFGQESVDAKFIPPKPLFENCFMQAMSSRSFSTSCNDDGTYSSKQCHEQRCWCTNKQGQQSKYTGGLHGDGIFHGVKALTLIC